MNNILKLRKKPGIYIIVYIIVYIIIYIIYIQFNSATAKLTGQAKYFIVTKSMNNRALWHVMKL